jgi:hypothetical protein
MFKIAAKNCPLVLDLNYRGFGLSAECLEWGGELLAVRDPMIPQGDHVPGARVQTGSAQNIVRALRAARLRFPFVVASVRQEDAGWPGAFCVVARRGILGGECSPVRYDRLGVTVEAMTHILSGSGVGVVETDTSRFLPPRGFRVIAETSTPGGRYTWAIAREGQWAPDWRGDRAENAELVLAFRALKLDQQKEPSDPVSGRAILA